MAKTRSIKKYTCDICKKYYASDNGLYNHKKRSNHLSVKDRKKNVVNLSMPKFPAPKRRSQRISYSE